MWVIELGTETTYAMRNISDNFYSIYYGGYEASPRWYTCGRRVNSELGFPMSRAYVDEFFSAEAKSEVVNNLRTKFKLLLQYMKINLLTVTKTITRQPS